MSPELAQICCRHLSQLSSARLRLGQRQLEELLVWPRYQAPLRATGRSSSDLTREGTASGRSIDFTFEVHRKTFADYCIDDLSPEVFLKLPLLVLERMRIAINMPLTVSALVIVHPQYVCSVRMRLT